MLSSLMPFQSQYINQDVLKKVKILYGCRNLSIKHHRNLISALHLIMTNMLAGKSRLENVFRACSCIFKRLFWLFCGNWRGMDEYVLRWCSLPPTCTNTTQRNFRSRNPPPPPHIKCTLCMTTFCGIVHPGLRQKTCRTPGLSARTGFRLYPYTKYSILGPLSLNIYGRLHPQ